MKKALSLILLSLILTSFSGEAMARTYSPLKLNWQWPIIAHDLYFFDLDQDGKDEIYLCSYNNQDERGVIHVLNASAHLILDTWVKGYLGQSDFKRPEPIKFIWLGDLDADKTLDIIANSEIKGGQVNTNILYRFERELDYGFHPPILENVRRWYLEQIGRITHAFSFDLDSDGQKELLASSLDSSIYVLNSNGGIEKQFQLEGSVWDFALGTLDQDEEVGIAVGYSTGITLIKGYGALWKFETEKRVFDVEILHLRENSSLLAGVTEDTLYLLDPLGNQKFKKNFLGIKGIIPLDVDNDTQEEILLLAESKIYALGIEDQLKVKWELSISGVPRLIYSHLGQVFIPGKKLYNFDLNPEYVQNELAMRYLKEAKDYYARKDCDNVLEKANLAREIFWEIENPEGSVECDNLIQHCSPSDDEVEEIKKANEYLSLGEDYFDSGKLPEAQIYLKRALELYLKWNYRSNAITCDSLLSEINLKLMTKMVAEATGYYRTSLEFLQEGDFENSTSYANKALQIYREINSSSGISNCQSLLLEIENKENEKLSSYYFVKAQSSYDQQDFENLPKYAYSAKEHYLQLNQTDEIQAKISQCDAFLALFQKYQRAEKYYHLATQHFQSTTYENSTVYVKEAKEIFQELGHQEGIKKCNTLTAKIDQLTGKARERQIFYLLIILGVIFFLAIAVIFWKKFK